MEVAIKTIITATTINGSAATEAAATELRHEAAILAKVSVEGK